LTGLAALARIVRTLLTITRALLGTLTLSAAALLLTALLLTLAGVLIPILIVHSRSSRDGPERICDASVAPCYAVPSMHRRFLFWGFKSSQQMLDESLGALEREVMSLAWEQHELSVREACERLGSTVAYTTVMTTMDRLYKKGLLSRRKVGRAFLYRAAATRHEIEGAVAAELVQSLIQRGRGEPLPVLSSLVDAVSDRDRALLDELERLIKEKRRAIRDR